MASKINVECCQRQDKQDLYFIDVNPVSVFVFKYKPKRGKKAVDRSEPIYIIKNEKYCISKPYEYFKKNILCQDCMEKHLAENLFEKCDLNEIRQKREFEMFLEFNKMI